MAKRVCPAAEPRKISSKQNHTILGSLPRDQHLLLQTEFQRAKVASFNELPEERSGDIIHSTDGPGLWHQTRTV
jgi:hypothetical protein